MYPDEVRIEKEFEHEYKANSRLFVSTELMVEFNNKKVNIFDISGDSRQTNFWDDFELPLGMDHIDSPIYFSPSFKQHLRFVPLKQSNKNSKQT